MNMLMKQLVLCSLGMLSGMAYAAAPLNDAVLAEQASQSSSVTPELVDAVKQDVQQPVTVQQQQNRKRAEEYSRERKKQNIQSVALSPHEEQKKTIDATQSGKLVYNPIPVVRNTSADSSINPLLFRGADVAGARGDVSVTVR